VNYDVIGDIHGNGETLSALLTKLGYALNDGVYRHATRQAIFIGDFIDRGPHQREVVDVARSMVEAGSALAVMGNHEFNAIAYATPDGESGDYLRPHSVKNNRQHEAFLREYPFDSRRHRDVIAWFKTLPLWLELDGLRVIHACWDQGLISRILEHQGSNALAEDLLHASSRRGNWQFEAIETLLKGKEVPLPGGTSFQDKEGTVRHNIRVRWWDRGATSYQQAYMGPESARTHIPEDEIAGDHLIEYSHEEPPVFLGHYWLEGTPRLLARNIGCVDYSVAKPGGKLVAYRWDGERELTDGKFVSVERLEKD